MKEIKIFTGKGLFAKMLIASLFLLLLMGQCEIQKDFEYDYSDSTGGVLNMTVWEFIQQTDSLSLMKEAITAAGMQDYYSGSTEYTFIVPRNSAFRTYMEDNGYASISDIPVATLQGVLGYHIVKAQVLFSDPDLLESNNPIAYETVSGEIMYLSHDSNYRGMINYGTGKSWTIITSNLQPTNGVIHITADIVYLAL